MEAKYRLNLPRNYHPVETDPLEAMQLFETALEKRERLGPDASLLLESELGLLLLRAGKVAEAKAVVENGKIAVEDLQVCGCCVRFGALLVWRRFHTWKPIRSLSPVQCTAAALNVSLFSLKGLCVFGLLCVAFVGGESVGVEVVAVAVVHHVFFGREGAACFSLRICGRGAVSNVGVAGHQQPLPAVHVFCRLW